MPNLLKDHQEFCPSCGVPNKLEASEALWDIYHRIRDGRSTWEPLVYTQDDMDELGFYDDEEMHDSIMLSMERNMGERGLCPTCGRPDLRGVNPEDIMSEEDAKDLHEMWAEQAAERRAGC